MENRKLMMQKVLMLFMRNRLRLSTSSYYGFRFNEKILLHWCKQQNILNGVFILIRYSRRFTS
jgi:hypothetical protein